MLTNSLFSPSQHGFIAGRSSTTQLLRAMDYWTQSLNDGYPVDIIYLDFRKAFDSSVAPIIDSIIGIGPILATSRLIGFD